MTDGQKEKTRRWQKDLAFSLRKVWKPKTKECVNKNGKKRRDLNLKSGHTEGRTECTYARQPGHIKTTFGCCCLLVFKGREI